MIEQLEGQMTLMDFIQDPSGWCGKTCQEHFQAGQKEELTSQQCLKSALKFPKKMPAFLCLMEDGRIVDISSAKAEGVVWHGAYMMPVGGALPREEREYHLSAILTDRAPRKYFLSAKACRGILNRSKKRGKALPAILEEALKEQIAWMEKSAHDDIQI